MLRFGYNLCLGAFLAVLLLTGGVTPRVVASSVDPIDEGDQNFLSGEIVVVSGAASFVRHRTLIPQYCPGESEEPGCIQPKYYWVLSVQAGGARYELDQMFALGQEFEPESIEIGDAVIRPGVRLSVTARVQVMTRDYSVLSDLQKVELLDRAAPFYGWTCQSIGDTQPVYVDVFQVSREGQYAMRVQSIMKGEDGPRTVASFDSVRVDLEPTRNLRFAGADHRMQAELAIDMRSGRPGERDSLLRVNTRLPAYIADIPVETSIQLTCARTR